LYENYNCTVIIAFDAGNLKPVAINVKKIYPDAEIIIAADNDVSGIGERKALEACDAIGCGYIMPHVVGTDWNDELRS
jgi:putative DNA primase/helicase